MNENKPDTQPLSLNSMSFDEPKEEETEESISMASKLATLEDTNLQEIKAVGPDGKTDVFKPDVLSQTNWTELGIPEDLLIKLVSAGYKIPSKCQHLCLATYQKFPESCLLLQAPNGTGKTLAFLVATLLRIDPSISYKPEYNQIPMSYGYKTKIVYYPQAIILAHTRELIVQISKVLNGILNAGLGSQPYKGIKVLVVKAGNYSKVFDGGHILITTPGVFKNLRNLKKSSFTDFPEGFGTDSVVTVSAERARIITIDECDEIFQNDDNKNYLEESVFKKIDPRAFIIFSSATINDNIKFFIEEVIKEGQNKETIIYEITPDKLTLKGVTQCFTLIPPDRTSQLVAEIILKLQHSTGCVIFVNTISEANKLMSCLQAQNIDSMIVHGKLSNKKRDQAIDDLQNKKILVLITTNLLSRGFDNEQISLVISLGFPMKDDPQKGNVKILDHETYLHRIGRTGRFTSKGVALTIVENEKEVEYIKELEKHFESKINFLPDPQKIVVHIDNILESIKISNH